jgi:hypothetical protein
MRSDGCRVPGTLLRWCSVVGLLVAAIGVGLAPVHPQAAGSGAVGGAGDKAIKATDLRGEWIRAGAGFACKVGASSRLNCSSRRSWRAPAFTWGPLSSATTPKLW